MTRWSAASCAAPGSTCSPRSRPTRTIRCSGSIRSWSRRTPRAAPSTWWPTSRATPSRNMQSVLNGEPLPPNDVIVCSRGEQVMATMQSRSVRRREDVRLLTGSGNYSADPHPPGMLHAVLVRSHHAHATVGRIDTSAARAMPGVVAVFTARGPDRRVADPRRHRLSAARRQSGAEDRSAAAGGGPRALRRRAGGGGSV